MTLIIYVRCKDATILALDKKESSTSDAGQGVKKYYMPTNREFVLALAGESARIEMIVSELHKNQDVDSSNVVKELHRIMGNIKLNDVESMVAGLLLIRDGSNVKLHDVQCSDYRETITEDEQRFKHYGDGSYLVDYLIRTFDLSDLPWNLACPYAIRIIDEVATQVDSVGSVDRYGIDLLVFTDDDVQTRTFHNTSGIGKLTLACDVKEWSGLQYTMPESTSKDPPKTDSTVHTETITVDDTDYVLAYQIIGAKIKSAVPLKDINSLLISLDASNDGELTAILPRSLIDAMDGNHNGEFFVLCDSEEVRVRETVMAEDRIITITFAAGCETIEIIGSEMFGGRAGSRRNTTGYDAKEIDKVARDRNTPLAIQTDRHTYPYGSDMVVTITNPYFVPGEQMGLNVTDDEGSAIHTNTIPVSENELGIYQELIRIAGRRWAGRGATFRVSVEYQGKQASTNITTKPPEMSIELDQRSYSWTDKVYIKAILPGLLKNSNGTAKLSDVDECFLDVSTSMGMLSGYELTETEEGSGIFAGEVRLTGFPGHDVYGDNRRKNPVAGDTGGTGSAGGRLGCFRKDTLTAKLVTRAGMVASFAAIQWNIGKICWLDDSYPPSGVGILMVVDPDMSLNPEENNEVKVKVWSDSDRAGIRLWLRETGRATGVFRGTVHFINGPSSGQRLKVSEGDRINAEYIERTLPEPHPIHDKMEIYCSSLIRDQVPQMKRASAVTALVNKLPSTPIISIPPGTSLPGCEKTGRCFMPSKIAVRVNQTVVWNNDDNVLHNITSGTINDEHDGIFGSDLILPGSSFKHKFVRKGTYKYYCLIHPWQTGSVVVE